MVKCIVENSMTRTLQHQRYWRSSKTEAKTTRIAAFSTENTTHGDHRCKGRVGGSILFSPLKQAKTLELIFPAI